MIAHPLFAWLGIADGGMVGPGGVALVLAIYVLFGLVALAIDRRALLVSALLMLSAFWPAIRTGVVEKLPNNWQDRLPLVGHIAQPA